MNSRAGRHGLDEFRFNRAHFVQAFHRQFFAEEINAEICEEKVVVDFACVQVFVEAAELGASRGVGQEAEAFGASSFDEAADEEHVQKVIAALNLPEFSDQFY